MKIPRIADKFEYWDIRVKKCLTGAVSVEDESLQHISRNSIETVGVRVLHNGKWSFVSSNKVSDLQYLFERALKLSRVKGLKISKPVKKVVKDKFIQKIKLNPFGEDDEEKIFRLLRYTKTTKKLDRKIKSVTGSVSYSEEENEFYDSNGSMIFSTQYYTNFFTTVTGRVGSNLEVVRERQTKSQGLEVFYDVDLVNLSQVMVERINRILNAKHAPPKILPVVMDNCMAGVFFHEAVGHACEADAVLENASVMRGKLGKLVGSEKITLIDGVGMQKSNGFVKYDNEGVEKGETVLIERGVLKNYLHSLDTAAKMGLELTGNGRSMSPASFPLPRMSTLTLGYGDMSKEELFEGIKEGVYVKDMKGGVVVPAEGKFSFGAAEAFMIRDGEVGEPLRGVSLSGDILQVLQDIDGVGKDFCFTKGGFCGKQGQVVPVDEFMPHVRVSRVMIGGRD